MQAATATTTTFCVCVCMCVCVCDGCSFGVCMFLAFSGSNTLAHELVQLLALSQLLLLVAWLFKSAEFLQNVLCCGLQSFFNVTNSA